MKFKLKNDVTATINSSSTIRQTIFLRKDTEIELTGYNVGFCPTEYIVDYKIGSEKYALITQTFWGPTPFFNSLEKICDV